MFANPIKKGIHFSIWNFNKSEKDQLYRIKMDRKDRVHRN